MRKSLFLASILFVICCGFLAAQTDEQRFLFDRAKKALLPENFPKIKAKDKQQTAPPRPFFVDQVDFLLKRKAGIGYVEDRIIEYRQSDDSEVRYGYWFAALARYKESVVPEDMPNRMVPEILAILETVKGESANPHERFSYNPKNIEYYRQFGVRGKVFLPTLEWLRDHVEGDEYVRAAISTIAKIKAAK